MKSQLASEEIDKLVPKVLEKSRIRSRPKGGQRTSNTSFQAAS